MASRSNIYRSRIDVGDIDKSRYFANTEFNDCLSLEQPKFVFIFKSLSRKRSEEGELQEGGYNYA